MKNIGLINGSLRGRQASSLQFLQDLVRRLPNSKYQKTIITVKAGVKARYSEGMFQSLAGADAIILVFPLFNYGLPGALMRFLEDYYQYLKAAQVRNQNTRVYIIVNCGFPRAEATTGEAVRVVRNFCKRLSLHWRFAVCIGCGPVVAMTRKVPFLDLKLKRAYLDIVSDIHSGDESEKTDYIIKPVIPEPILIRIKNYYEKKGRMIEPSEPSRQPALPPERAEIG
jgi:hypothetical protein